MTVASRQPRTPSGIRSSFWSQRNRAELARKPEVGTRSRLQSPLKASIPSSVGKKNCTLSPLTKTLGTSAGPVVRLRHSSSDSCRVVAVPRPGTIRHPQQISRHSVAAANSPRLMVIVTSCAYCNKLAAEDQWKMTGT